MLNKGTIVPTLNLENIDPLCANIRHVRKAEQLDLGFFAKNNFALGGVNTSIVIRRYEHD